MKAIQANLLRAIQSGPRTSFEQMENAVLEEHGFLTTEVFFFNLSNSFLYLLNFEIFFFFFCQVKEINKNRR